MEKKDVRIPQQKRSIEKKEKIIEAAFRIYFTKGYFGTNTADIAKEADISTGSIYAYFKDKKDILLACLNRFGDSLTEEIRKNIESLSSTGDIQNIIKNVLYIFVNSQKWNKSIHDEIMSLQYRDEDVKSYFVHIQKTMMDTITRQLNACGYTFRHEPEQEFLFRMVMGIEDELAFDHSPDIDKDILIDECTKTILSMLTKK